MSKLLKNKKTQKEYTVSDAEYFEMLKDSRLMAKYEVTDLLGRPVIQAIVEPIEVKKIPKNNKK